MLAFDSPFTLRRIRLNRGGYDSTGRYWGGGAPLYHYSADYTEQVIAGPCEYCGRPEWLADYPYGSSAYYPACRPEGHVFPTRPSLSEVSDYLRADSRDSAKFLIIKKYPNAKFLR